MASCEKRMENKEVDGDQAGKISVGEEVFQSQIFKYYFVG